MKITKARLRQIIKEEVDAMRFADPQGAGIEDIPQPEDEETVDRDRAYDSPEERFLARISARKALSKMTRAELEKLVTDLDAPTVAVLRNILSNNPFQ